VMVVAGWLGGWVVGWLGSWGGVGIYSATTGKLSNRSPAAQRYRRAL